MITNTKSGPYDAFCSADLENRATRAEHETPIRPYSRKTRDLGKDGRIMTYTNFWHSSRMTALVLVLLLALTQLSFADSQIDGDAMPYLAKWYDNKAAAVSLRFDDSSETHVDTAIPFLNRFGIKGTFMVNPGRRSYKKHKNFWESKVPKMGHHLGNHTWSHKGAKTLQEAEREIARVSELIWKLYPQRSKLTVFASGGGETWAGEPWENASREFRRLPAKYHLIDLYDGNHPSKGIEHRNSVESLCHSIETAINNGIHQPFTFHRIGRFDLKDWIRKLIGRTIYTLSTEKFENFILCLKEAENRIWIGELVQVYKYETEFRSTRLELVEQSQDQITLTLNVDTDPTLYDQVLTLVIPGKNTSKVVQTINGNQSTLVVRDQEESSLVDVVPQTSTILVLMNR